MKNSLFLVCKLFAIEKSTWSFLFKNYASLNGLSDLSKKSLADGIFFDIRKLVRTLRSGVLQFCCCSFLFMCLCTSNPIPIQKPFSRSARLGIGAGKP